MRKASVWASAEVFVILNYRIRKNVNLYPWEHMRIVLFMLISGNSITENPEALK